MDLRDKINNICYILTVKLSNKYKPWTADNRRYLESNYLQYNNAELAYNLERTEDAIRKELAKLKLKRPKRSDYPKVAVKRGRKKKILSLAESIQQGIDVRKKQERNDHKEKEIARRIANEALWASEFINDKKVIKCKELIDPVIVRVPTMRAEFKINSNLPDKKIQSRIAAIAKRFGSDNTIVSNF